MIAEQLKKSILQAAIQGKLTQQLPKDGDARDLLKEIKKEKARLIKDGKIKKEKPLPEITEDEIPFEIPENWCWVRLGEVFNIARGGSPRPIYDFITTNDKGINWIKISDSDIGGKYINQTKEKIKPEGLKKSRLVNSGDLLLTNSMSFGRPYILNTTGCIHDGWLVLSPFSERVDKNYFYHLLSSEFIHMAFANTVAGAVVKNLNSDKVRIIEVPLPPVVEQKRIVECIEKLLTEIESLKNDETRLEELQKSFPKKMKNAILQYAIQGKLTQQLPEDGDARDLLKEIQKEKARLIKEGKIKKEKPLPEITEDEIPFEIPENWCWVRLGNLCEYLQRGKSPIYSPIKKYPVIAQKCNQWEGFSIEKAQFIDPATVKKYTEERILKNEDLMWNSTGLGTLGRIAIYEDSKNPYGFAVADSHVTVIRMLKNYVCPLYIFVYLSGPYIQSIVEDLSSGSTKQKELLTSTIEKIIVPLPPMEEQKRIMVCLEKLTPLCEELR
jgi:type I restriction enzyme S subunit